MTVAVPQIMLKPLTRLRHPGAMYSNVAEEIVGADLCHSPPRGSFRPGITEGLQLHVGFVCVKFATGGLNLRQEGVRDTAPIGRFRDWLARVTGRDMTGKSVVRAPRQFRSSAQSSSQIIRSEYFHDFPVYLHKWALSWPPVGNFVAAETREMPAVTGSGFAVASVVRWV